MMDSVISLRSSELMMVKISALGCSSLSCLRRSAMAGRKV